MKKNPQKITLSVLAHMISGGFDDMQQQLDGHNEHFERIESRLGTVERKIDTHTDHFEHIERKLDHAVFQSQFERLQDRVGFIEKHVGIKGT